MTSKIANVRRCAVCLVVVAVLGGAVAPIAHAGPKGTTTTSGKKWK